MSELESPYSGLRSYLNELLPRALDVEEAASIGELDEITERQIDECRFLLSKSKAFAVAYFRYLFVKKLYAYDYSVVDSVVSGRVSLADWVECERVRSTVRS